MPCRTRPFHGRRACAGVRYPTLEWRRCRLEDLDVFEERGLRPAPGSEPRAMHEFGLESAEEALHCGVVQAVPLRLRKKVQEVLRASRLSSIAAVLGARIRTTVQARRSPLYQGVEDGNRRLYRRPVTSPSKLWIETSESGH
jgi:hypothetical protein